MTESAGFACRDDHAIAAARMKAIRRHGRTLLLGDPVPGPSMRSYEVIVTAIARRSAKQEAARRADWARRVESGATFGAIH